MSFPQFDLAAFEAASGPARKAMAVRLDEICRDTGFVVLTGHGVDDAIIANQWQAMQRFFDQPLADKQATAAPYPGYPYGYLGPNSEALAKSKGHDTPPDLKESFNGGPAEVPEGITDPDALAFRYVPTPWPDVAGFRHAWQNYYAAMENLAGRIMAAMAQALSLPSDFFAPYIGHPISALRALHYPATQGAALKDQQRAGAHSDYGSLTILLPQPGSSGLQIARDDGWLDVPAPDGAFVINIGDLMARWTADRWVSTLHRVVAKPDQPARQSIAFFHQPDWDAEIVPLDGSSAYPPVRSGPYLMEKFKATGQ
ncbi:isopenicillin N synthase family dioxygenase [Yoonia sp. 208BN28-4]|uniref:isopenicillin N synthase family dioxygenase n=1 Tax=Yoonia sp. 208BN28-4 TaxID=3126505 RepID=UPI00309FDB18